MCKGINRDYKN